MQNILKTTIIFSILFFLSINAVSAIDCEYPNAGLVITYDKDSNVTINHDKFQQNDYYQNLLGIAKWGSGKYSTDEIHVDQTLFEKYQGYSCPTAMHVCEYGEWSLDLPSLSSLGYKVADLVTQIPCWTGHISDGTCDNINSEAWSLLNFNIKKLYIYTQEEYEKSNLALYEGGLLSDDLDEAANEWFDKCKGDSDAWYAYAGAGLCWVAGGVLEGVVWETLARDGIDLLYYRYSNCDVVDYDGPYKSFNINCGQLYDKVFKFMESLEEYKTCGSDFPCKSSKKARVNEHEDSIKKLCKTYLESYDYGGAQQGCVDACLNIKDTLNDIKEGTDLYDDGTDNSKCGFSGRLITWIINIIRWLKYILPVFVIVLGILDFIKSIASDKDDEMKKAQKRFIIRLIAAALVFLIPLIIEFVLTKMGFDYNDCGLFK